MIKHLKKAIALLLCTVMLLGIAMPAAAAASPNSSAASQLAKRLRANKSVEFGDCYVYPYATAFDTTIYKGDVATLSFKRDHTTPGGNSDKFYVLIVRGSSADYIFDEDIVEERTYSMKEFNNSRDTIDITWKADSRYPVGYYCLYCCVLDSNEEMYEQTFYSIDLNVVSGKVNADEVFPYQVYDGSFYSGMPDILSIGESVCLMPSLYPFNSTTERNYKLTVSDPSLVDVKKDCGYYYLTGTGFGFVDITLTCGKLTCKAENVIVGFPNSVKLTPGNTNLCVGMTDTISVKTSPDLPAKPRWESSNSGVATVHNGVVTAVAPGTVVITARLGQQSFDVNYTVNNHALTEDAIEYERTATMPHCKIGHCDRCGQDNAMIIYESAAFSDTPYNAWYAEYVDFVYENMIMNGIGGSCFGPNNAMSRAMVATSLYRLVGEPEATGGANFSDVPEGQWYTDAISWASANGIVTGYPDGTFRPNTPITREQFAAILYRYTLSKKVEMKEGADLTAFPDSADVQSYAVDAMRWAIAEGLITGIASGDVTRLAPRNNTTRAQFATIITRYMQSDWTPLPPEEETPAEPEEPTEEIAEETR